MDNTFNPSAAPFEPVPSTSPGATLCKEPFSFDPKVVVFNPTPSTKRRPVSSNLDSKAIAFKPSSNLNPEAAPFKAPFQLSPEAAPFKPPFQFNPKATPFKTPFELNPEATPFKPFQLNPKATAFKPPFQFNPEAPSFEHRWQLNPEAEPFIPCFQFVPQALPFKPPFQLNPEATPFKPSFQLNPEAPYFLPLALQPWEEQSRWFRVLQWLLHLGMTHVVWSVATQSIALLSVLPGTEVYEVPDVVGLFKLELYPQEEGCLPYFFHPQGPHHYNWLCNPVYEKSFTKPATSLTIIQGPPKLQVMPVAHIEPRDLHQQLLLRRGFHHIDPVVFVGSRDILQLSGTALEDAATGLTEKFYAPGGWWRGDFYDEYDDIPQLDPLDEVSYNPEDVVANGMYADADVRLPEHWTEAQQRAAQKAREEGSGTYKVDPEYNVGKSKLREVWNASDMDDFEVPLSDWADEADELPSLSLEIVNDAVQQIRKDLNIAATDKPVSSFGETVQVADIDTQGCEKTQDDSETVDPGSEDSTNTSSPSSSVDAIVRRTVSNSLTSDEDDSGDLGVLESEKSSGRRVQDELDVGSGDEPADTASLAQFMESEAMSSPKSANFGLQHDDKGETERRSTLNKKQSIWHLRDVSLLVPGQDSSLDGKPVTNLDESDQESVEEDALETESNDLDDDEDVNVLTPPLRSPIARPQGPTPSRMCKCDADADSAVRVLFDSDNEDAFLSNSPLVEDIDVFSPTPHATGACPKDVDDYSASPVGAEALADKEAIVTNKTSDNAEVFAMLDKAFDYPPPHLALLPGYTPPASEGDKDSNRKLSHGVVWFRLALNGKSAQQDTETSSSSQTSSSVASPQIVAGSATKESSTGKASPKASSLPPPLNALTLASPSLKVSTVNGQTIAGDLIIYSVHTPSTPPNMSNSPLALSSHAQGFFANFSGWHLPALAQVSDSAASTVVDLETTSHEYTPTSLHNRFEDVSVGLVSSGTPTIEESPVTEEGQSAEVNIATPAASRENLCHGMTSGEEGRIQTLTPVSTPTPATRLLSVIKTRDEQRNGVPDVSETPSKNTQEEAKAQDKTATATADPNDMSFKDALNITPPKLSTRRGRTLSTNHTSRRDIDPSPTRARARRPYIPTFPSAATSTRATAGGSPAPIGITPTTASGVIRRMRDSGRRRFSSAGDSLRGVRASASWRVRTQILGDGTGDCEQNEDKKSGLFGKVWRGLKDLLGREMNVLSA